MPSLNNDPTFNYLTAERKRLTASSDVYFEVFILVIAAFQSLIEDPKTTKVSKTCFCEFYQFYIFFLIDRAVVSEKLAYLFLYDPHETK